MLAQEYAGGPFLLALTVSGVQQRRISLYGAPFREQHSQEHFWCVHVADSFVVLLALNSSYCTLVDMLLSTSGSTAANAKKRLE